MARNLARTKRRRRLISVIRANCRSSSSSEGNSKVGTFSYSVLAAFVLSFSSSSSSRFVTSRQQSRQSQVASRKTRESQNESLQWQAADVKQVKAKLLAYSCCWPYLPAFPALLLLLAVVAFAFAVVSPFLAAAFSPLVAMFQHLAVASSSSSPPPPPDQLLTNYYASRH